jgi:xanthine dehydrogenase YagR molybdenum-binding subunit
MATTTNPASTIGTAVPRVDGPLKTTGTAKYAADFNFKNTAYGVPVCSTIAKGKIVSIDTDAVKAMPGVLLVLTHDNIGPVYHAEPGVNGITVSESRPPFEDNTIRYWGQYVAVVVAETFEQATAAAHAAKVKYEAETPNVSMQLNDLDGTPKIKSHRGDADAGFAGASVKLDETYATPVETHNPIEMHASVAVWDGDEVTLYETTQGVMNAQAALAQILGVPKENVKIVTKFLGSGFGGKLFPWPHSAMTAIAARKLQRPVKLVLDRQMMFQNVGHRPRTQQRMRLGASADGKLVSLAQDYSNHTSFSDDISENCGEATPFLYSVPNLRVSSALVRRNVGTPAPMRGPGAVPGLFALESAMDEMAIRLNMDPVEFRIKNEPAKDESTGQPFSSRHLLECYKVGTEKFGWSRRTPAVGSMRNGDLILGWGMAAASWIAIRLACEARVQLKDDGTARMSCGTQDIGTGTYTIFAQVVNDKTGIPLNKIDVVLGDSSLTPGPISGGSFATASVLPAILDAVDAAIKNLLTIAPRASASPFRNIPSDRLAFTNGWVHEKDKPAESGVKFSDVLKAANVAAAIGDGKSESLFDDPKAKGFSTHSFGVQFVEVEWDPGIAHLRVSRVVTVMDGGKIINLKAARNQIEGAVVMGIGMGMLEHTIYDQRYGSPVNSNLADYVVATCADSPDIDVTFLDYPDMVLNPYGARGIGEIGLAGVAPAITAAVYHATGVRVRELPVRLETLLGNESRI